MILSKTLLALVALSGCKSGSYNLMDRAGETGADGAYDTGWNAPPSDESDSDDDLGSETEEDSRMLAPAATDAYVFVANQDRNTLTRISVPGLEVITVEVGTRPVVVRTTADYARAVSFNSGSDDLSIVDAATLAVSTVPVLANLNAMELSPDGRWALCYHDADVEEPDDDDGAVQSFNEVTLVDTVSLASFETVVGQSPRQVVFTDDSTRALVVSDEALTVFDLSSGTPVQSTIPVADDPLAAPVAEEVALSPDGAWAFVRQYGAEGIKVVDMATEYVEDVPLGDNPTDLDLTADGRYAVVVCRAWNRVYLLDTADPFAIPTWYDLPTGETLGSVVIAPEGDRAILYTTAVLTPHYTVWDLAATDPEERFEVRELVKPIETMTIAPDGETLVVFHTKDDAPDASAESPYWRSWAMTLLNLRNLAQNNPLRLAAEPTEYAHSTDGGHGFFMMDGVPSLEVMDYGTLIVDDIPLRSVPEHVGVLPDSTLAYVSQAHELGRVSFYDTSDGSLETVTGFELNSQIEH